MRFRRYLSSRYFAIELESLHVFRERPGDSLLESLEAARLVTPRVRVQFPDPLARRLWIEDHSHWFRETLCKPVEPDGPLLNAAKELRQALTRWEHHILSGSSDHPFEAPSASFAAFIQDPETTAFVPHKDLWVDVSEDESNERFSSEYVERYFNTWQVLLAAEIADAGVHIRARLSLSDIVGRSPREIVSELLDQGSATFFETATEWLEAAFARHQLSMEAVVWFVEEAERELARVARGLPSGRFRLDDDQARDYEKARIHLSNAACQRYGVSLEDLVGLSRFLSERFSKWNEAARAPVASAYKEFLSATIQLASRSSGLSYEEIRDRVGYTGAGRFALILDQIWPDWIQEEQDRVRKTLEASISKGELGGVTESDLDAFVEFLAANGMESFFWHLKSFEQQAFHGNDFAVEKMKSDLQNMSVAIEHIAEALGATSTQLLDKFRELWRNPTEKQLLTRESTLHLARRPRLPWADAKAQISALRQEEGGDAVADLVMTYRIRGGLHGALPEKDPSELEFLFVTVMRAGLRTFLEGRGKPV